MLHGIISRNKLKIQCSDKYAVRSYVKEKGLEHILVPLCGGPYEHIGEVDLASLPSAFVLKATHGCAMNIICNDKEKLDIEQTKKHCFSGFKRITIEHVLNLIIKNPSSCYL